MYSHKIHVIHIVILKGRRRVDDSLLSIMFHVAELILELYFKTDSDWSRWTLLKFMRTGMLVI